MQVSSQKMIIAVIVDGHLFPELRHSDAKMCRRLTYLTTQRCKGCNDIIVISLTTGVMRETIRSFQLSGTSRCASQKDTKRQKWLFTLFSGPFGRRKARFLFFLLYAAWVRSRAERPSVSYTKVVMGVAWTGHNLQFTKTN